MSFWRESQPANALICSTQIGGYLPIYLLSKWRKKIAADSILAERLDAFVSRFGRLQDTVGDKLIPALLIALAEPFGPVAENLDRAEKFGFIESADTWLESRKLRNQMVHEYLEDLTVLASALRSGHAFVPSLVAAASRCVIEAERLIAKSR